MGRPLKNRLFPVALSLSQAATCLGVSRETIVEGVRTNQLPYFHAPTGSRKRVLVADLVAFVRTWRRV